MKNLLLPLFLLSLIGLSCNSGKKALRQGRYGQAVDQAVNRLRQSPNNRKAAETLVDAYDLLLDYNLDRINRLKRGGDTGRWEEVLRLYGQLNRVYDEIQRSPVARELIPDARFFGPEYEAARIKAAEVRYALAEQEIVSARRGDREAAKQAYRDYARAEELLPGFRDARAKSEEALDLATLIVQVEPIPMHSRTLDLSNAFFQQKIREYLRSAPISEFVLFLSPEEVRSLSRAPDHRISMRFDDFVVGQAYVRETVNRRVADSVVVGSVEVEEKGEKVSKDVYGTVRAEVHIFQKQLESAGLLDLQVIDSRTGSTLRQEKFSGTHIWVDYWGFYNGDERALTEEDRRKLRKKREVMPPPPQDLFIAFAEPIYEQVTRFLGAYYRGY